MKIITIKSIAIKSQLVMLVQPTGRGTDNSRMSKRMRHK